MTQPPLLMGIDLGTSSVKTVIISPDGYVHSIATCEYSVITPQPGWAEQNPEIWFNAAAQTAWQALHKTGIPAEAIVGIGLCGLMHGTVFLNKQGSTPRPAIIWADQRSFLQVERIIQTIGIEKLGEWTGNPLATGFMLPTWLWIKENEPEIAQTTAQLLLPKDYLRYRLTGNYGSEPSDAASTSLFNPAQRKWSNEILQSFKIDPVLLPPIHPSAEVAGELTQDFASITGLKVGIPVVYGGSDQACQALGHGVIEPGVISCTIGTGGQLFAPTLTPTYDTQLRLHMFCHVLPGHWHLEAATLSAGLSLKWLRDHIFERRNYQQLADLAVLIPPGSEGLYFIPYLVGERTPHMDPQAKAGFLGLTLRHERSHLVRAVMEGVVYSLKQGLDLMLSMGIPVDRVIASGGATAHPLWLQLQADIFDRPIYRTTTLEAAAVGAAMLAGVAVGIYPDAQSACREVVKIQDQVVTTIQQNRDRYAEMYPTYCQIYPTMRKIFHLQ